MELEPLASVFVSSCLLGDIRVWVDPRIEIFSPRESSRKSSNPPQRRVFEAGCGTPWQLVNLKMNHRIETNCLIFFLKKNV
jgi:hypothetical protein